MMPPIYDHFDGCRAILLRHYATQMLMPIDFFRRHTSPIICRFDAFAISPIIYFTILAFDTPFSTGCCMMPFSPALLIDIAEILLIFSP